MALQSSAIAKMIVQYEWILENVEKDSKKIASKMILFRGKKMFRVCLKNRDESPVLYLVAVDLKKIGMRAEGVICGIQDNGSGNSPPTIMSQMAKENINDEGSLQLFTLVLLTKIAGNCTFVFRIHIEGSVRGYSYQLSDRLAKDQLWDAAKSRNSVDVQLVVKDKTFDVHKAVLAARSPVFAAKFTMEQPVEGAVAGPHQIHIQ